MSEPTEPSTPEPADRDADLGPDADQPSPAPASLLDVRDDEHSPHASPLLRRLEAARRDLLELSTRNRLLSTPRRRKRSRAMEIVDEQSDAVFGMLVHKGNALTFEAAPEASDDADDTDQAASLPAVEEGSAGAHLRQPEETPAESPTPVDQARTTDRKLQTLLSPAELQKRLLRTFYDARTSEQEQGVNTLYLALGFLKWFEDESSDKARYAPLLLVPVHLERKNARTRFSLTYDDSELNTNLSLQAKLKAEFGLDLPDLPEIDETFAPSAYFEKVREAIGHVPRWEVLGDDMVLSFFSFSKFLMYRDLDTANWGRGQSLAEHPLLNQLLGDDGFPDRDPVIADDVMLDEVIPPEAMVHVVPADTSQAIAVEGVRRGRNLVIQGPPGTGKSQTIANLIAAAVKEGKKILFVAEKMAALEVVKRRLTNVGLGDMCLELHSHKARKRAVLDDLEHTLSLGEVKAKVGEDYFAKLTAARDVLNHHASAMHTPIAASGITPYRAIGKLVQLRAAGVAPSDLALDNPLAWTPGHAADARVALRSLLEHLDAVGLPAEHPWRGAAIPSILPMDLQRLAETWPSAAATLRGADEKARTLADAIEEDTQTTANRVQTWANRARRLAAVPALDRDAIIHDVWAQQTSALAELVQQGLNLTAVRKQLGDQVNPAGWSADLAQTRLDLASFGKSWLRWLNPAYKRAKRQLAAVLAGPPPKPLDQRLKLVDQILEAQHAIKAIERDDAIGRYAFGTRWRGEASDWDLLGKIHGWDKRNAEHGDGPRCRELAAKLEEPARLAGLADAAEGAAESAVRAFEAATSPVQLDLEEAFGVAGVGDVPLGLAAQRLTQWSESPDGLSRWMGFRVQYQDCRALGLGALAEAVYDGQLAKDAAEPTLEMVYHEALLRAAYENDPQLARFDGDRHAQVVAQFGTLDQARIALARREVAAAHQAQLPQGRMAAGQMGVLLGEFNRKRGHLPIRQLIQKAGLAIQAIKPVFMMSPMSVAQYLEPGGLAFDLILMDEASQVRPVDALGAIARGQQVVVVGDDKQLPPTSFFDSLARDSEDEDQEDDDGTVSTGDLESILGLCKAQAMPSTMLRWHYRSKHPSLIAVSNREFYDSQLFIIPSPDRINAEMGLTFHHITEGHYDRSGSRTHEEEAKAVARAVMRHAAESSGLTLGVGTFSVAQRDAILDQIELLRREDASVDEFFAESGPEPFFVKNLENIQGDERDVIFISVGYGKDAAGKLTMNFGPLSNDGGERRLNVLISRSKRQCVVFSSITSSDIDPRRVSKRGPIAFKSFLHYAEHGIFPDERLTDRGFDSPFEEEVARALKGLGYEVEPQVGTAGFYVDLAVIDPEKPGQFLLGIECDGASYHSSRSARERDRAKQSILEMQGWTIHRIWSTDWFNRPQAELDKLTAAIEQARHPATAEAKPSGSRQAEVIERDDTASPVAPDRFAGIPTGPYVEAKFKKLPRKDLDELDVFQLIELVTKIVEVESPVHGEEVMRRAADIYQVERMTSKITGLLESALADAVNAGKLEQGLGFYSLPGVSSVKLVRSRADVESPGLRKPEMLPPAEVRFALESVAAVAIGVGREDAIIETSRLLGFASTRSNLREVIERELEAQIGRGVLEQRDGAIFVAG